jgi:uncharacterized protein YbjT (DUF2867 family)
MASYWRERHNPSGKQERRATMILVVGATGVVGGMVTGRLLDEEKEVRILARRDSTSSQLVQQGLATSAEELAEAGAQTVHGDLRDRASLDAALEGIETVITTANSAGRGGADNPQSVDLEGNRNLIEAAREARVERFVFVSLLGADPGHPSPFVRAKVRSEAALRESGWITLSSPRRRSWSSGWLWWSACPPCRVAPLP